jgi:TonB family protein
MNRPHLFTRLLLIIASIACAFSLTAGPGLRVYAQQASAQELYGAAERHHEAGEYQEALAIIEGLLKSTPDYAPALLLKSRALVGLIIKIPPPLPAEMNSADARRERKLRQAKLMKDAADSLERFLQLKPDAEGAEGLRARLSALRFYAEPAVKPESEWPFFSSSEVTEKAHILRKPPPLFPEEARSLRLGGGTVKVLLILAADGTVKHILALKSPGRPFTESAIEAASKIKFEPAVKDGHTVSTAVIVEYHFQTF